MNIQTTLDGITPYQANHSYPELAKALEHADTKISFWGARKVYSRGYDGSVLLEDVAQKVINLVKLNPDFNLEERKLGYKIQSKIFELYDDSVHQEKRINIITHFFMGIRELFEDELIYYKVLNAQEFDYFTLKQYEEAIGKKPSAELAQEISDEIDQRCPLSDLTLDEQEIFGYFAKENKYNNNTSN